MKENVYKAAGNSSQGKGFRSQNWAAVGEQVVGKTARQAEMCNPL